MTAALAFLMPPTGALFVLLAVPLFLLRLTLGEEAFSHLRTRPALPGLSARRSPPVPRLRIHPAARRQQAAVAPRRLRGVHLHRRLPGAGRLFLELQQSADGEGHPCLLWHFDCGCGGCSSASAAIRSGRGARIIGSGPRKSAFAQNKRGRAIEAPPRRCPQSGKTTSWRGRSRPWRPWPRGT